MFTMLARSCWPSLTTAGLIIVAACAAAFPGQVIATSSDSNQTVRKYSISADKVWWDYAPLGLDGCSGQAWDEGAAVFTVAGIGSKYLKATFREYDYNFTVSSTSSLVLILDRITLTGHFTSNSIGTSGGNLGARSQFDPTSGRFKLLRWKSSRMGWMLEVFLFVCPAWTVVGPEDLCRYPIQQCRTLTADFVCITPLLFYSAARWRADHR